MNTILGEHRRHDMLVSTVCSVEVPCMGVAVQMRTLARIPGRGYTCGPW